MSATKLSPGTSRGDLMSPGGGLLWHLRALRYRRHWRPFCAAISQWLSTWPHGREHLLLLGGSAGWCMPTAFLASFRSIHAVDLDPLAPWLFNRLHGAGLRRSGVSVSWQRADIFDTLGPLLKSYPAHAILFGNMLGQHRYYCSDVSSAEAHLQWLTRQLQGRVWASFHDRLSVDWKPGGDAPQRVCAPRSLSSDQLARRFGGRGIWTDHLTEGVIGGDVECLYLPWHLLPGRLHLVEAAWHADTGTAPQVYPHPQ